MDEAYALEITKLAVARAGCALGFKHIQKSAMDSLSDLVKTYIRNIASTAKDQAEMAGRAHAGIQDVIPCLEYNVRGFLQLFFFVDGKHLRYVYYIKEAKKQFVERSARLRFRRC
jgi:histone H3/H4